MIAFAAVLAAILTVGGGDVGSGEVVATADPASVVPAPELPGAANGAEPLPAPPDTVTEPPAPATDPSETLSTEPATEAPEPFLLPDFDEDELVHGGTGDAGAILAGPGIVRSSGADRRTPWELLVPSAQLKADIVKVGLTYTRALGSPDNPDVIGWWESGPAPGQVGNVLLDGHRDYTDVNGNVGTGVCWQLPNTDLGDFMLVRDHEASMYYVYSVAEIVSIPWNDPRGVEYLQRSDSAILTLITCEGSFDGGAHLYSHRRIVVAEMIGSTPFPTAESTD